MKKIILLVTILVYMGIGCTESECEEKKREKVLIDWTKYKVVTEEEVKARAKHYIELVVADPAIGIQQVNMDGVVLEALLFNTEGFKLIAGADLSTNAVTMYIQLWRRGIFSYYDINSFFNSSQPGMRGKPPLCPPPAGCDLPFLRSANPEVMTETKAQELAQHYNELVARDPSLAIQQITMDGLVLDLILYRAEGFKLIAAADIDTNEITAIMQFWKDGEFTYYDIRDIFTPDMRGMRGKAALCPPPAGCDLP